MSRCPGPGHLGTAQPRTCAPCTRPRASSVACSFRAGAVTFPASVSAPLAFAFSCLRYIFSISSTLPALCLVGVFQNFLGDF